jgi:hypothetical protein
VNRHYLKLASPVRLAALSVAHLKNAGFLLEPTPKDLAFLAQMVPPVAAAVDRLDQVPLRLKFLFDYSAQRALDDPACAKRPRPRGRRRSAGRGAGTAPPMLDRESFRAVAARVREEDRSEGEGALSTRCAWCSPASPRGSSSTWPVPAIEHGARSNSPDRGSSKY